MVNKVAIKNFKSIRELEFEPRRVNVFIGEPNTGKSNILEALAVFSEGIYEDIGSSPKGTILSQVLRFKRPSDLFFDRELSETIKIIAGKLEWMLKFDSSFFNGEVHAPNQPIERFKIFQSGQLDISQTPETHIRYYSFKNLPEFNEPRVGILRPPYGANLASTLITNKRLRSLVSDLFRQRGFRLSMEPEKNEFGMAKDINDQLIIYSYPTISETFRRIIFFMAVLDTNQNATLILDEPEANTFPFYTKYLAERIALDETNQFFIATHNPYLLSSVVEKTPAKNLAVFVTQMEDYQTRVKQIPEKNLSELLELDSDAFFNLNRLVEE